MCVYLDGDELVRFQKAWAKTGKKLDMGKSCVRFKKVEDLALDVIGDVIQRTPAKKYIARYLAILNKTKSPKPKTAKKPAVSNKNRNPGK
jgi:hypothetical protein